MGKNTDEKLITELKKFPQEYDNYIKKEPRFCTYKELINLHIKPIKQKLLEKNNINGPYIDDALFHNNKLSSIVACWKKHKKGINDIRKDLGLDIHPSKYITIDEQFICDSKAEMQLYNILNHYSNEQITFRHTIKYDEIDSELVETIGISNKGKGCSCDWQINTDNKTIMVEIWGANDKSRSFYNNKDRYLKQRKLKEQFWTEYKNKNTVFIGIDYENCKNVDKILDIFKKYIDIDSTKSFPIFNGFFNTKNFYEKTIEEGKKLQEENGGLFPCFDRNRKNSVISSSLEHRIYALFGSIDKFRKALDEDLEESKNKIKVKKNKQISETHKNNGHSKGEKNPMYGKKGKEHPKTGKKQPPKESYEDKYIPKGIEYIKSLENNTIINESRYIEWAREHKYTITPWKNPSQYNPWKNFIDFINNVYIYCKENEIDLPNVNYNNKKLTKPKKYLKYNISNIFDTHIEVLNNCKEKITVKNVLQKIYDKCKGPKVPYNNKKGSEGNKNFGGNYNEFKKKTIEYAEINNVDINFK